MYVSILIKLTTALPGTFFIYQLFELFTIRDTSGTVKNRLNDNILLAVFSLPYVYDLSVGIVSIILMSRIATFNETLFKVYKDKDEEERKLLDDVYTYIIK